MKYETNRIFEYELIRTILNFFMKPRPSSQNITTIIVACIFTAFSTMGFTDPMIKSPASPVRLDTVPAKHSIDIHINMSDLNEAIKKVSDELNNIEWNKISEEVKASIRKIDMEKISDDVASSLKSINWDKIQQDIDRSLNSIDLGNIDIEIRNAQKDTHVTLSNKELKKIHEMKLRESRRALKRAKAELKRAKKDLERNIRYRSKDKYGEEVKNVIPLYKEQTAFKQRNSCSCNISAQRKNWLFSSHINLMKISNQNVGQMVCLKLPLGTP